MKELGKKSDFYHLQIIKLVIQLDLEKIIFIGEEFYKFKNKFKKFNFYKKYEPATKYITNNIDIIKNIFVMGSRYYKLDRIIKTYVR